MRAAIRALVRFIFWFVLTLLVASALVVAAGYVTGFDPLGASTGGPLLARLLAAIALAWIPSILVAAAIALSSALRALRAPMVAVATLFIGWTVLLVAGSVLLSIYPPGDNEVGAVLPERRLVRMADVRLYAMSREQASIPTLVIDDSTRQPGFSVDTNAELDPAAGELVASGDDRFPLDLRKLDNSYPAMVTVPPLLAGIASDVRSLARLLSFSTDASSVILNLAAIAVFLTGTWTLVRLTRWPMFNAMFVLAALRFAIWIIPAVQLGGLRSVFIAAFSSAALPYASAIILGALGAGLLALLVFLPPLETWRREVEHG